MRLIDANKISYHKSGFPKGDGFDSRLDWAFREDIDKAPTVDAVVVVRCKDCEHCSHDTMFGDYWCYGQRVFADYRYCGGIEYRVLYDRCESGPEGQQGRGSQAPQCEPHGGLQSAQRERGSTASAEQN